METKSVTLIMKEKISAKNSILMIDRSSCPEVFCKKGILRNFAKFTGKHLCHSFLFNSVASLRPATLLKKRLWHRCFPKNFSKFLGTPFLTEHLRWLFLDRLQQMQETEAFITVKDNKEGFPHTLSFRLINPSKFDIGKISQS